MTATLWKLAADFSTTLNLKTAIWATSATLDSATDDDGVALPTGTYFLTIDRKSANKEYIKCTLTGTALTSISNVSRQGTITSGTVRTHRKWATVEITDFAIIKKMLDLLDGTTNFNSSVTLGYDGTATISSANQFATKAYVDATATGTTNFDQVVIAGNAGATVSAGQLVYLDVADGEWKLCDADTAWTVDNIVLGIAQWAGTDGNTITGGVLTYGLDSNQTGLTNNTVYYASNTAGGISTSAGTTEVTVGVSRSTTSLFFDPRYNQQITEDIQDALAGTSGTPSSTNKYVTNDDTATAATASKVARRLAGGNITVVTESQANNSTNAASTAYVDTGLATIPSTNLFPNSIVTSSSYFTQVLMPTVWPTADAVSNGWVESSAVLSANQGGGWIVQFDTAGNADGIIYTAIPWFWSNTNFLFSIIWANAIYAKTRIRFSTSPWATEAMSWWLNIGANWLIKLEDSTDSSIRFCLADNTGDKLYAVTANWTNNTNTNVTGSLTLTDWLNLAMVITSTQVLFYAGNTNALTLVATHTTHIPTDASDINIGWGIIDNGSTPDMYITPIYLSLPTS